MKPRAKGKTTSLLIYSHYFIPSVGGVETSVLALASGLSEISDPSSQKQFHVTVVAQTPAALFDDQSLGFRVVRHPSLFTLARLILKSDVLHLAGPSLLPLLLGYLARKPVVLEHHGYQSTCPNGLLIHEPERSVCPGHYLQGKHLECLKCQSTEMPLWKAVIHMSMMLPRHLLSRSVAANISITNHVLERQRLPRTKTIYYGIEDSAPLNGETLARLSGKLSFAYVGRLVAEKGIPIFLESIRLLKEEGLVFDVKLVGEGPQRAEIERLIQEKQIQEFVTITGFLKGDALHKTMQGVSVVVMPSVWEETAGLAAIEQMMRGRLVIASKIGGLAEVIGSAGLLSPAGDPIALAQCMRKVIQNPALVETFGKKARDRAATLFTRSHMVEEHARVYLHLVDSKAPVDY